MKIDCEPTLETRLFNTSCNHNRPLGSSQSSNPASLGRLTFQENHSRFNLFYARQNSKPVTRKILHLQIRNFLGKQLQFVGGIKPPQTTTNQGANSNRLK